MNALGRFLYAVFLTAFKFVRAIIGAILLIALIYAWFVFTLTNPAWFLGFPIFIATVLWIVHSIKNEMEKCNEK